MTTVQEIKAAIDKLSLSERAELEKILHGWEDDEWDRQMIADAKSGKLDQLLGKVNSNIDAGTARPAPTNSRATADRSSPDISARRAQTKIAGGIAPGIRPHFSPTL